MVVKFFKVKQGGGDGTGSIKYLLDSRVSKGTARILQGDKKLTQDIILSLNKQAKACVGCLSFEEENLPEAQKYEIMRDFENMLMPEMQGRYNILWVEHTDKGRLELNFVIPKVDLVSGRAFNPYYHKIDVKRKDLWTDLVNLENQFSDPKDPMKARRVQDPLAKTGIFKDVERLDIFMHELVAEGAIDSRDKLIEVLKNSGVEVTRQGDDYISVKLENQKKAIRLKGGIYERKFKSKSSDSIGNFLQSYREREKAYTEDYRERRERLKTELASRIETKARFYREFCKRADKGIDETIAREQMENRDDYGDNSDNIDNYRGYSNDNIAFEPAQDTDKQRQDDDNEQELSSCEGQQSEPLDKNRENLFRRLTDERDRNAIYRVREDIIRRANRFRESIRAGESQRAELEKQASTIESRITELAKQFKPAIEGAINYFRERISRIYEILKESAQVKPAQEITNKATIKRKHH